MKCYNLKAIAAASGFKLAMEKHHFFDFFETGLRIEHTQNSLPFGSSLCRFEDMITDEYKEICQFIRQKPVLHRKQWEYVYIISRLDALGKLGIGSKGIGFGVGREPLPAAFSSKQCTILATDAPKDANDQGWELTGQLATSLQEISRPDILPDSELQKYCQYKELDMNNYESIPSGWDFHWSSCVIEHLGGIQKALDFVVESSRKLAPGGVAVHTTEFNLSSNEETLDMPGTCILRKRDLDELRVRLTQAGLYMEDLILDPGSHVYNYHVDCPPYRSYGHLRLELDKYVSTSIGIVVINRA
jgi:hypothetical protein